MRLRKARRQAFHAQAKLISYFSQIHLLLLVVYFQQLQEILRYLLLASKKRPPVKTLATTSDRERLENPRPLLKREKRWKKLQRRLSRKVNGGNHWKKAKLKVAKLQARISDTRRDTLQKFT